tara:strand:- start:323 stop:1999 length:1677 start_codon:yes stop_codon:yes gene_type:complete
MAIYTLNIDGKTVKLKGERPPTEAEAREAANLPLPEKGITADSSIGEVATTALGNVGSDIYNLGASAVEAVTSPVKTMEGIIDLGSAGMSKALDVTGLSKYADPAKMEQYRKYRGVIADEASKLATEEGIKKRIAEKPVTTLLDLSVLGRGITAPLKAQQYSSTLQKLGDVGSKVSSAIDPTQLLTKPAGMAFRDAKTKADIKASQMADVDVKNKSFTDEGFVIPPSAVKSTGTITKGVESLLGGGTKGRAIEINQNVFNKKARNYVDPEIPEGTPLTKMVKFVENKYKDTYNTIKSYKPVVLKESKTKTTIPPNKLTPETKTTPKVVSRSGKEILKDIQDIKRNLSQEYKKAKNKAVKDDQPVDYKGVEKVQSKLEKAELELETLAKKYGDENILSNLKEAKQSYARAFNVENSVKKGSLDATDFYKRNTRNKAPVTGEGKKIMDFVEEYGNIVKTPSKSAFEKLVNFGLIGGKYGAAGKFGGPLGIATLLGAEKIVPRILLSNPVQKTLSSGNYMPTGSGLLNAASNRGRVGAATFVPSLLETTKAEYAPYLYEEE